MHCKNSPCTTKTTTNGWGGREGKEGRKEERKGQVFHFHSSIRERERVSPEMGGFFKLGSWRFKRKLLQKEKKKKKATDCSSKGSLKVLFASSSSLPPCLFAAAAEHYRSVDTANASIIAIIGELCAHKVIRSSCHFLKLWSGSDTITVLRVGEGVVDVKIFL